MIRSFFSLIGLFLIGAWANVYAAAAISVSPASLASDANTVVTHTITGLQPGETVTVERIADVSNFGVADFGEPSLRIFKVTDGTRTIIDGIVNSNVPGDDDGSVDGAIRIDLPFPGADTIFNRQPGKYIVRVTNSTGQSATTSFEITASNLPQRITGVLKNSSNNANISFGIIVILVGNGDPIGSVRTDSTGAFSFIAPPGDYLLVPFADGFAANAQFVNLPADQIVTHNLMMDPAPARISGKLTDADSGAGLPGVFIIAQVDVDDGQLSGSITDSNGNFGFNATPGAWEIRPMSEFASQLGYVVDEAGSILTIAGSPITQNLTARKATALIHGRVTDALNNPIAGLQMRGRQQSPLNVESHGRTGSNGEYVIGVLAGDWHLTVENAALLGFRDASSSVSVGAGAAAQSDFDLVAPTAHVRGRVVDASGNGIANVFFSGHFENSGDTSSGDNTAADGSFDVPVWGGSWHFNLGDNSQLLNHIVRLTVVDGIDQNITFVVPAAQGTISGAILSTTGQPIAGIGVNAHAIVNGTEYESAGDTDSQGHYTLPAINGDWQVSLNCDALRDRGFDCPGSKSATISLNNQTVNFTIPLFVATASLNGRVVNSGGSPVGGVQVSAFTAPSTSRNATTQPDGTFSIPVFAGQWSLQAYNLPPNLISSYVNFTVTDGANINDIQIKLLPADVTVSGTVKSAANVPVLGIRVFTSATIDGQTYSVPFTTTDLLGQYSWTVARGAWMIHLDCSDLSSQGFDCPLEQLADTTLGSVVKDFIVTAPGTGNAPTLESPRLEHNGAETIFEFRIVGDPGTFDILARADLPTSAVSWTPISTATINAGASSALVRVDPQQFRFFRAQRR